MFVVVVVVVVVVVQFCKTHVLMKSGIFQDQLYSNLKIQMKPEIRPLTQSMYRNLSNSGINCLLTPYICFL